MLNFRKSRIGIPLKRGVLLRVILLLLLIITQNLVWAGTYYVALNGSNSNNGTIASPWYSIMHAIRNTAPGDTILIRGGLYPQQDEIWIRNNYGHGGEEGKWKTQMA